MNTLNLKSIALASMIFVSIWSCNSKKGTDESKSKLTAFDISYLDSAINPCDNFYGFAIGNWQKMNPIPETESRWMAFNILYEENRQKLLSIVTALNSDKKFKKGTDEQLISDFFKAGMDSANREKQGISAISFIINEINEIDRLQDVSHLFGELAPLGVGTPVGIYIGPDKKNSNTNAVYASQSGLSLPDRDFYISNDQKFVDIREAYLVHLERTAKLAGIQNFDAKGVLELETKIAKASWSRTEMRDPNKTYNPMAFSDWDNTLDYLDLKQICATRGLKTIDTIIISHPSFYVELNKLMANATLKQWKDYLSWKTINSFAPYMSKAFEDEHFAFYSAKLKGTQKMKEPKERVFDVLNDNLGEPIGKLFVKQYFSEESKKYLAEMIENLRAVYKIRIENLAWMSDQTKKRALKKLAAFTYKVGYPDEWEDYSSVEIKSNNYVANILNLRRFGYNLMLEKQGKPVDKKEWHMTPQTVNAYYSSSNNEIVFPAGILQPPFFHKDFDDAINYGGIGAVIGHEFSHGFDDQGSKYDWNGNLNDWWTEEDRTAFETLASKLGRQYSSYQPIKGMNVNGDMTMGENIADLGGVTMAYEALKIKLKNKNPKPIDGFSWQQRFFLGWANVWKGNIKQEELLNRIKSDVHSPAEFRVVGPLANFDPFYEAFGTCEHGTMYKPDTARIKIW